MVLRSSCAGFIVLSITVSIGLSSTSRASQAAEGGPYDSFAVERFHLAGRSREIGTGLVVAIERRNLVVVGACELVLRGDHFDVGRDARAEPVLGLGDAFACEVD